MSKIVLILLTLLLRSSGYAEKDVPAPAKPETITDASETVDEASLDSTAAPVFGHHLFNGNFATQKFAGFNPHYHLAVGDKVRLQLWGAYNFSDTLTVDPQGNIFIDKVGPVHIQGVKNEELNTFVKSHIHKVFQENVEVYVNLDAAQEVSVYVGGFVNKPGLYAGRSSDSLLYYLDKAQGITAATGSYIGIKILRAGQLHRKVNLYDFLLQGKIEPMQFVEGDTIFVEPIKHIITVVGEVNNKCQFEFAESRVTAPTVLGYACPKAEATHLRIIRQAGKERSVQYVQIKDAHSISLNAGDLVKVVADKPQGSILVTVRGEHFGEQEHSLPYGSRMKAVLDRLTVGDASELDNIQLFRKTIAIKQKVSLDRELDSLQANMLSARSELPEEAATRIKEAQMIKEFIKEARKVKPKGQVVLGNLEAASLVRLEDGDVINIPTKTSVVMVQGEVMYPTAVLYHPTRKLDSYIDLAGGPSQNGDMDQIVVLHVNGQVGRFNRKAFGWDMKAVNLRPGDEIMVLPKINSKGLLFAREITGILYKIASSSAIVLRLR